MAALLRSFDDSARDGTADKTGGAGISRLGGVTFGSDEDSFHSDDYEREKVKAVAAGRARRANGKENARVDPLQDDDDDDDDLLPLPKAANRPIPSAVLDVGGISVPSGPTGEGNSTMLRDLQSAQTSSMQDSSAFGASPPISPALGRRGSAGLGNGKRNGAMAGRMSLGGEAIRNKGNHLTLREQEKVIDEVKKENFNLKLKIYFLEDRLAKLAPDHIDQALKENIEIKVEFQSARQELKKYRRLLIDAEKAIETLKADRDEALSSANQASTAGRKAGRGLESELRRRNDDLDRERSAREQAEKLLAKAQTELRDLRDSKRRRTGGGQDDEEVLALRRELREEREAKEELMGDYDDLRDQLANAQDALAETNEELDRMAQREDRDLRSSTASSHVSGLDDGGRRARGKADRKLRELEEENASLRSQINAQVTMLSTRNGEKEDLQDEVESLRRTIMELEDELELRQREADKLRASGRSGTDGDAEREALQEELNNYRDKLAAALLEAERREKEIEELIAELDEKEAAFNQEVDKVAQDYKGDLDDARAQRDELQNAIDERDDQIRELSEKLEDLIAMQEESGEKLSDLEQKLQQKEEEVALLAEELEATQADLKDIGAGNRDMAGELDDKEQQIASLNRELDELEQETNGRLAVHEEVVTKLKQKLATSKSEHSDLKVQHESAQTEVKFLRDKVEDLAMRHAEMEERRRTDSDLCRRLEDQLAELEKQLDDEKDDREQDSARFQKEKRDQRTTYQQAADATQKALAHAESELAAAKLKLATREDDLEKLQTALRKLEKESNRLTESQTHDRYSLELEIERLQRDLANAEDELEQARADADDAKDALHSLEVNAESTRSEKEDLVDKLAKVQRARREAAEKFEEQTKSLRKAQDELAKTRSKLQAAENEVTSDHRKLSKTEQSFRDQLSERNTLLLTVYQHLEKLASAGTQKKASSAEAKPFTNFNLFQDNIISRLKSVGNMQTGFDGKLKEVEQRLEKQYNSLKRQHDGRLRQLDQFETSIKAAADVQRQWRQRVATKQGEVDAHKATAVELQKQIDSLRQRASIAGLEPGSLVEGRHAQSKVPQLERRLTVTQAQLKSAEQKLDEARVKVANAEGAWQARLRELQERNRELEEKVKRERQGAKERVNELLGQVSDLKEQVTSQHRRGKQLDEVLREAKASS